MNLKQSAGKRVKDKEEIGDVNQSWTDLDWSGVRIMRRSFVLCSNRNSKPVAEFPPGVRRN